MPQFETSKVYLTRIVEKLQYVVNHILDCKEGEFYDFNEEGNFCDKIHGNLSNGHKVMSFK